MRKKKETYGDKENNSKCKGFQNKNSHSILKINDEKMKEFSKSNVDKLLKELNSKISKNNQEIDNLNKHIALNLINNRSDFNYGGMERSKISKLSYENNELKKEVEYISSGQRETKYILNTCSLLNQFIELEELGKTLMTQEDQDVEQALYELNMQKNNITDEYMRIVDPHYTSVRNVNCKRKDIYCEFCNCYLTITGGFAVCYDCGNSRPAIQHATELSYKEMQEMDYRPQFTYEKISHLDDWLRRFQAKEHKEIPQEILDKVVLEAHKQRIKDLSTLTEQQVKKFLKKLELNDYYDNVISIINRINKRSPFILTTEVEHKIKEMFQQIQAPFEKYKDPNRKNMLSYSYLLHHFFLILDLPQFSKYFFLLKSPEKLRQQDQTFKKIVDELAKTDPKTAWRFFPSL